MCARVSERKKEVWRTLLIAVLRLVEQFACVEVSLCSVLNSLQSESKSFWGKNGFPPKKLANLNTVDCKML